MGWELRKGKLYYYQKTRIGKHIISRYMSGERGELAAKLVEIDRERRALERAQRAEERARERAAMADSPELAAFYKQTRLLLDAATVAAGYHRHKHQWRKRRDSID
jgi:hypothetical protein